MTVTRSLAVSLLLAVGACASNPQGGQAPRPVPGEDGPGATISATYTGGIIAREVTATFNVSEAAFVVVGHLGGDGMLRVLYPSVPDRFTVTYPTRRGYRTEPFFAGYDGAPSLHSFTLSPYRNAGARFDSYDGRGYGYVFIIASNYPMATFAFSDDYDWVDLDVQDYFRTSDPRVAIRVFAERLTGGRNYTLKFARSYSTQNHSGYAAMAFDCAALSSVGMRYLTGFWDLYGPSWSAFGLPSLFSRSPYLGAGVGCAGRHYASYYDYYRYGFGSPWTRGYNPYPQPPVGTPPAGPITPVLTRPTERGFGERAGDLARSELTRSANTTRNARDLANTVRTRRSNDNGGSNSQITHRDMNRGVRDPMSSGGDRAASSGAAAAAREAASNARTYTPATSYGGASAARDAASTARVSAPPPPPSAAASAREAASSARQSTPPPPPPNPNPPPSNPQK